MLRVYDFIHTIPSGYMKVRCCENRLQFYNRDIYIVRVIAWSNVITIKSTFKDALYSIFWAKAS